MDMYTYFAKQWSLKGHDQGQKAIHPDVLQAKYEVFLFHCSKFMVKSMLCN